MDKVAIEIQTGNRSEGKSYGMRENWGSIPQRGNTIPVCSPRVTAIRRAKGQPPPSPECHNPRGPANVASIKRSLFSCGFAADMVSISLQKKVRSRRMEQ